MAQKTCYVKCVSNEQAQKLRGELVKVGFRDDEVWNDIQDADYDVCIDICSTKKFCILSQDTEDVYNTHLLYTLSPDENLTEAAVKIKELFDNQ